MPHGFRGYFGLAKQTAFKTAAATGFTFIPFLEENVVRAAEQLENKALRGVRGRYPAREGLISIGGNVTCEVYPNSFGHILRSLLGAPTTSTPAAGVYQHVFTPAGSDFAARCPLPPYTVRVHRDIGQAFQFVDAVVNTLELAVGSDQKVLKATIGLLARDQSRVSADTLSYEATETFLWRQAQVRLASNVAGLDAASPYSDIDSFQYTRDNKLKGQAFLDGSNLVGGYVYDDLPENKLVMRVLPADDTEYQKFVNTTDQAMEVKFTGALISGTYYYELRLRFAKVRYTAYPLAVGGPGPVIVTANADAFYSSADGWDVEVRLINTQASY